VEDGYQFVADDSDYMDAVLECWVRAWQAPLEAIGTVTDFYKDTTNYLEIYGNRRTDPANSYLRVRGHAVDKDFIATWKGTEADAFLASATAWHVAAVLDSTVPILRLYVGGQLRASSATDVAALPAGDYTLRLGMHKAGGLWPLSAVLDEVRLSASARYATNFTPYRLLAAGTYESLTFDAVRIQADWIDLVSEEDVPGDCEIGWEVRAADETDGFGRPQAIWQPYAGQAEGLPDGRYFQWRATLGASADQATSPTLVGAEAQASEAGYDIYGGSGPGPEAIDYDAPIARAGPSVREIQTDPLAAETVHWFGIRPVDVRGVESPITQSEARLELDASGARVPDRPAGVLDLVVEPLPLGAVHLVWQYRPGLTGVVPEAFRIFGNSGSGEINYDLPLGEVLYQDGRVAYAATVEGLASGIEHQLAVRAVAQGEVWDEQPATAPVTPDADAPGEVAALEAEVVL
jgi:hypothetical protein